MSLVV